MNNLDIYIYMYIWVFLKSHGGSPSQSLKHYLPAWETTWMMTGGNPHDLGNLMYVFRNTHQLKLKTKNLCRLSNL